MTRSCAPCAGTGEELPTRIPIASVQRWNARAFAAYTLAIVNVDAIDGPRLVFESAEPAFRALAALLELPAARVAQIFAEERLHA